MHFVTFQRKEGRWIECITKLGFQEDGSFVAGSEIYLDECGCQVPEPEQTMVFLPDKLEGIHLPGPLEDRHIGALIDALIDQGSTMDLVWTVILCLGKCICKQSFCACNDVQYKQSTPT